MERKKPLEKNFHRLKSGEYSHNLGDIDKFFGKLNRQCREMSIDTLSNLLKMMDKKYRSFQYNKKIPYEFKRWYRTRLKIVRDWRDLKIELSSIRQIDVYNDRISEGIIAIEDSDTGYSNLYVAFSEDENSIITWDSDGYQIDFQAMISSSRDELEEEENSYRNWQYWSGLKE